MANRELTDVQKIIKKKIPDFFQWHPKCQERVEELVRELMSKES